MKQNSALLPDIVRTSRTLKLILQPAGQAESIQQVPQAGVRFYIVESDSDSEIGIKTSRTQEEFFTVGTGKEFREDQFFTGLEVRNLSSAVVTIILFAGFGDYVDRRTTIVGNRLTSILPTIEAKTKPVGGQFTSINPNSTITLTGIPGAGQIRRKAIVVSNNDANLSLQIRDAAGNPLNTIQPASSHILPISEEVQIHNPNPSAVSLTYGEIWWIKP